MKDLQSILKLMVIGLIAAVALALVVTGRDIARGYNERELLARPRTLHQMVMESEAAERPDRSNTLLFGAGLLALVGLGFGAFLFTMRDGATLLRERRLGRKKKRRAGGHSPYPTIEQPRDGYGQSDGPRMAPTARMAPMLGDGRDPYYPQPLGDGRTSPQGNHPGER